MVVDSDIEAATTSAAALEPSGWHVQIASTMAEARLRIRSAPPRIVLLDMWQPDGSGAALVRDLAGRADIGVIVVSACNEVADRVVGLELGADDYLAKPVWPRELTARVRALNRRISMRGT